MRKMQTMLDDERPHQTLLRGHQKMRGDGRQLCGGLDTLVSFRRWRTLTIYLRISLELWPAWRCLDFATISSKSGTDQLLTCASLCWQTRRLSLLSPPLLYAQLDSKL